MAVNYSTSPFFVTISNRLQMNPLRPPRAFYPDRDCLGGNEASHRSFRFFFFFFFFFASKTHTEKEKKLHRINKVIKRKKKRIANLHTYMAKLTNIKLDYSSANSIYYCT